MIQVRALYSRGAGGRLYRGLGVSIEGRAPFSSDLKSAYSRMSGSIWRNARGAILRNSRTAFKQEMTVCSLHSAEVEECKILEASVRRSSSFLNACSIA